MAHSPTQERAFARSLRSSSGGTRVAWLADPSNTDGTGIGGAEMTAMEFAQAAPDGVEVVYVPRAEIEKVRDFDTVCVFNVALYPDETLWALKGKRVIRYFNDVAPHGSADLTLWLLSNATCVFCSPLHYQRFPWRNGHEPEYHLIPPPVDLESFRKAAEGAGERAGAVSVAPWRGWGKTPWLAQEWAQHNGGCDFFGGGQLAPSGSVQVPYDQMPDLLARYKTFVYLPTALEPFCRVVAEAWAAGCELVVNNLIGARYWIEEEPERLDTAAQDFWQLILGEE
jgi:hypothetical protein